MTFDASRIGDAEDLTTRLKSTLVTGDKPVAFIVGSGVSIGAVDDVKSLVAAMRNMLDPAARSRFDQRVQGPSYGEMYQQAAHFLEFNLGQDTLNKVIRRAVLRACTGKISSARSAIYRRNDPAELTDLENNTSLWHLPDGVKALGSLLRYLPAHVRGPVITTNFDPLLEIAVAKAGGRANFQYFDLDGKLIRSDRKDEIDIAHVHGYWRRGDTLHTVSQLQKERPQLHGSLRKALTGHTVVVIGYSGWDDPFSRSLRERVREQETMGIDLIWCSHDQLTDAAFSSGLFHELVSAPRTYFYDGIDANELLPRVLDEYLRTASAPELRGWEQLSGTTIARERRRKFTATDVIGFFDGAEPNWSTALDTRIPRLSPVGELTGRVHRCLDGKLDKRIVTLVGPMGEGKSIALRQATVNIISSRDDVTVYWRKAGAEVAVDDILAIPQRPGHKILLVSDDGALIVDELQQLLKGCTSQNRSDVHLLLAAQEREWRNQRASLLLGDQVSSVHCRGLTQEDGDTLINAWQNLDALGDLAHIPADLRVARLIDRSRATFGRQESSLVGAMLHLRYGPLLTEHVAKLLQRLEAYPRLSDGSLRDAFLLIAIMHSALRPGSASASPLSVRVLAKALGLQPDDIDMAVKDPLGKEAAITGHGDDLWIRHRSIADAALQLSRQNRTGEITSLINRLVRAAVALSDAVGPLDDDLYAVAYLCSRLNERDEAIVAAEASVASAPSRLSYRTSYISVLRTSGRVKDALRAAERAATEIDTMVDPESKRGFLLEWGTAAGQARHYHSNALLDGLALRLATMASQEADALLALGVALVELHKHSSDAVFLDALSGVVALVEVRPRTSREEAYLARHRQYAAAQGARSLTPNEAWKAVQAAVDEALVSAHPPLVPLLKSTGKSVRPGRVS